jgi:membrane protein implicated in regulation of membrane protease activity
VDDQGKGSIGQASDVILLLAILLVIFAIEPPWNAVVLGVACVAEIGEVAFLRRWAKRLDRRTKPTTGVAGMVGRRAEVVTGCRPYGTVRIDGELWDARCKAGADEGEVVSVQAVDGLTLVVTR